MSTRASGTVGSVDAAFQQCFVDLVTRDAARAAYEADRTAYLAHLPEQAQAALLALDPSAITRYALSLKAKRWRGLAAIVPLTRAVSPSISGRYKRWLGRNPSPGDVMGLSPGESEGLRCLTAMRAALANDPGEPPWAGDVFACEVLRACSHRDGRVRQLRSRFPVQDIMRTLNEGGIPFDEDDQPQEMRFERHRTRWRRR